MRTMHSIICLLLLATISFVSCKKDDPATTDNGGGGSPPPAELVGVWWPTSATLNGVPVSVGVVLQWTAGADTARFNFAANGTYAYNELDSNNAVIYNQTGTVAVNGNSITVTATHTNGAPINPPEVLAGTWAISGNRLTLTSTYSGIAVVMVLTKG